MTVIEHEINPCIHKDKILVPGCGSGLEIERIKFPSNVVGVDTSSKMLDVLKQKKLYEDEKEILSSSSFREISLIKECTKTKLYKCLK